jgi:SAM-dependent methyltransferase
MRRWVLAARELQGRLRAPFYRGDRVECPCCGGRFRGFLASGPGGRPGVRCPRCGSLERHRLLWLYLERCTDLFSRSQRILHVAPEPRLCERLATTPGLDYVSADLDSPLAEEQLDIQDIPYPDASFDAILCCHVLEHVPDDRRAMRELHRILAPGGWAVLQTPVRSKLTRTDEDPSVTDPAERIRRFGQADHVRVYGADFEDRLRDAGFAVRRDPWARDLEPEVAERFGLRREDVIVGTRGAASA